MWTLTSILYVFITGIIGSILLVYFFRKKTTTKKYKILEIINDEDCKKACMLIQSHCKDLSCLGFDCEWITECGERRPVALLQLATVHGLCCLFRLCNMNYIPAELENILNNGNIIKLGVCPSDDAALLQKDYHVQVIGTLDLRYLYPSIGGGLANLANQTIGIELNKDWRIRSSNWESWKLTEEQKDYAAKDAFVAIEIFKKWIFENSNIREELRSKIIQYVNIKYKSSNLKPPLQVNTPTKVVNEASETPKANLSLNKKKLKATNIIRKSPLYHNCFMHAPDGELLCSCDRRKADWYIEKGLAEIIPGEPFSIKLLFEPAARANESNGGRFYQQLKQNHCVVCGTADSYLKYNVVPREYRKHFPVIRKNHQSHDIVLMCITCHQIASHHASILKEGLAVLCDAPIKVAKVFQVKSLQKIKNYARAIQTSGEKLPSERRMYLEEKIKQFFGAEEINERLINEAASLKTIAYKNNIECHGAKVVNYFANDLTQLEILWRKYFLDTMKPLYLPALWSVSHNQAKFSVNS